MIKATRLTLIFFITAILCPVTVSGQFDGERAMHYLKNQVKFGPRNPGSTGHDSCLAYLVNFFGERCEKIRTQSFDYKDKVHKKQFRLTNVIASYKPENSRRIFLAAHWDTRPRADMDKKENRATPILGANDGASGVAVLMEIANNLNKKPPPIGVDLILFDGEDYGREGHLDEYFLGSRYFAQNKGNYNPRYGILLDMVGDANLNLPKEQYSYSNLPHIVNKIWSLANSLGYFAFEDRIGIPVNDDHVVLMKYGIPCVDVIDFDYPDKSHRYWHTLQDTPEKCSPVSLMTVGQVMLEVIYTEY